MPPNQFQAARYAKIIWKLIRKKDLDVAERNTIRLILENTDAKEQSTPQYSIDFNTADINISQNEKSGDYSQ